MLYLGNPALTIFVRDKTKQVENLFTQIALREEKVKRQQAESFSSLISHETRTPLNSAVFFLRMILTLIQSYPGLPKTFEKDLQKYCSYILSQLTLSLTFVDDMLDLG